MKSTLVVVKQIQALRWQGQSDKVIKIEINEKMRKSNFNEQQIKDTFIDAYTVLEKETAESDMTNLLM